MTEQRLPPLALALIYLVLPFAIAALHDLFTDAVSSDDPSAALFRRRRAAVAAAVSSASPNAECVSSSWNVVYRRKKKKKKKKKKNSCSQFFQILFPLTSELHPSQPIPRAHVAAV
jgi:hypothetical protein